MDLEDFNPVAGLATLWTRDQLTPANLDWLRSLPQGPFISTNSPASNSSTAPLSTKMNTWSAFATPSSRLSPIPSPSLFLDTPTCKVDSSCKAKSAKLSSRISHRRPARILRLAAAERGSLSHQPRLGRPAPRWRLARRLCHVRQRCLGRQLSSRALQSARGAGKNPRRQSAATTGHAAGNGTVADFKVSVPSSQFSVKANAAMQMVA